MGLFDHLPDATSSQPTQPAAKKPGLFDHLPDAEPVGFTGAVARGFKRSLPETKSLLAGAGAAAAGAVGLDGVRDKLLDTYQGIQQNEVAPLQAKTGFIDAVTGDGSLKEWAGDTLGNFGGQALQSVAAAGAGALVGSLVPGAGTVAGGVGGLLFKAGAKEMVTDAVGRMVAKGVAKDVAEKTALRRLGGAAIAGTGLNVGQEIGTGYTGRAEDAKQSGEQLTQTDALRAIGYGIPAGLVDTAAEALTGSRLMRGVSDSPKMLSRMAKGAGIGAVSEGATEGVQAVLERAGANQALTGDAAYRDYIENIAAGALGGGVAGAGGGFRRQQDPAAPPPPETPPPMTPEVNASQALPPAPSPLATPPVGPMTRAAATVPGAPPLATPPATTAADTAQTPTDALPPLIADTAGQAVAAPPAADPVFEKAKELLAAAGKVNRKQLRADLGIKENQMQTLLDQLHAAGIVGPSNGNKARKLLVNPITGDVLDPDEKARLDRKVERDAQQRALEEAVRGGKPAAAIEAAAAAQGQQPEAAQTPSPLSRPPMTPEFEAKMRERQAAALTRAQRPDPATGATSKAAAVAFDTGAAAAAEQQAAQAAQDQQAQAAVTAQAEADKAQQQQQKMAEKAAKEADKAARQAEKDRVQAEKTAPAQDVDIQAVVAAEIESGKPMDGMRMHALAKKLNVTPKRIDDMRMALAQKRKRGEPLTAPTADAVQNLDPIAQGVQNVDTQDQFAEPSKMVDQYDDSPDVTEDDITPPSGGAFSIRSAAESTAKRTPGGKVFEVDGGFVVRVPRAVVNESLTTAPDPGLEDALRQERDAYTNERDDAYLNKTKHARDPLKDAVEDAVNASVLDPDAARVVLDVALSNGRVDLAEYAVSRAERAVAGMSVTPGVPQNSPKYADIKAALESRKREATALLDSLKKDLAAAKTATVKESLTVAAAKPKEAIATDVAGEQLDDKWTAFAPETGTLNVPRADMPQVKSEHRGAMVQYLAARGITHEQAEVPADSLKPTQAEFSAAKVKKALKRAAEGEDRAILVSADGHVLDGHHQWLAKREAGAPVKVIRLNAPIADLLQQVKEFPSSTQAKGATAAAPANTARSVVESELAAGDKSNPQLVAAMRSKDATKFVDLGLVELPDKLIDRGTRIERLAEEIASEPRGAFRSTIYNLGDGRNQYSYVVSDGTGKPTNVGKHDRNDERWTPAQVADRLFESEVYDARQQLRKEAYEAQTTEAAKGFKEGQKVGAFDIYVNSKLRKFRSGVIESIQGDALQMLATMVGVKADSHRLTISILNLKEGIERAAERKPAETTQEPTNAKQEAPRTEQAAATGQAAAEAKPEALLDQKAAQRAAIDAETMETRGDAPQVAQPTKGKRITVNTVTLNGPTTVLAHLYELPNYNGPQLAVSEKKRGNQTPYYRVYLPKSGAFIADNPSTASDLAETLKLAVLRIQNARDALQKAKAKPEKADDAKSSSSRQVEAPGLSTAALEAFLKPATEALRKDGVQIHVITTAQLGESTGDAAEDDRRAAMKRGMGNKKSRASVSGDRQHVYFFADKIKTIEEAGRVAAHELVGHIGMERLLGGRWAELRAAVLRLRDAGKWPELFDEVRARYASNPDGTARGMDDDTFAAEAIAVFAERNVKTNILQAAMVAARGWLRRTFPNQEIEISQDELRQLVWEAGRMVKGKRFRSGVVEDVLGSAEPAAGSDVNPDDLARALRTAQVAEPEPAKPKGTMARKLMPRGDAVAEVQRQLKVTKKRATEIVNEIKSEAKNLDGVTYNLKPGIVQTADVQAAIERERGKAVAPAKPEAPLTVGDQATAAIPAVKRRLREARNRGDAKAEAEIERELQQLRAKVWDESPLPKPEDAPAPAQQALQESEWDQIVSTHKLRLQQEHGIASRTAGNPVSWQYMKEPQRAKLAADVRAIIANGGIDPQVDGTPAPAKPEKGIVGRRADGVMIREDERGVRWYAQGGVRIFETVSMRPTRQGMQIDRGVLQREFMTAEESAAAAKAAAPTEQPKAKPAPSANTIVTDADAEAARARLKAKFTRLNSGIDPEMMLDGITLGMYHIERGARTFAAYAKAMVDDLGDAVKPYLKSWYMGVKYDPRAAGFDGMDSAASVESAVVDSAPEPEQDSVTEDSTDAAPKPVEPSVRGGDPKGVPVAEGRRERPSQPGNAPPDTGDVAPAQPENVGATGASEPGSSAGVRASAADVAGKQESQGSGNARPGRKGAGGKKPPDAGAGRTDTAKPVGRTGDGAAGREGADPRGPQPKDAESVSPANPGPGNFHIANPLEVVGGGQVARFNKNKAAIELFVALRDEGRRPTREEQEVLAGYTGWGSFGQDLFQGSWAYPQPKQGWEQRDQWLRDHLGKSDWEGLQRSITNAHYTDPPTVMAMWEMVRRMGFKGGRVLEPGMGIGNFFGMMPLDLKERSKLAGIELDPVTGGMAQMLYPDAAIKVMGYQDSKTPDDFYDLVIGNWPFENTPVADRRYNRLNPMLHDYFFLKTLDQVRPGGIVIGITSAGSMDKKGAVVRRELAKKAELIASFRLPSGAFEDYAGTKVVTDIIVLRKRPEPASNVDGEAWVDTVEMDTPAGEKVRVNAYYQKNPQNVVGTIDYGHGTTTFRPGLIVHRPENMQAQLDRIVSMVPDGAYLAATRPDAVSYIANHTSDREGALTRTDAGLFIVRGEHLAPAHEVFKYQVKSQKETAAREAQLNALIDMRKSYGQLIEAERGTSGAAPEPIRTQLRERYEAFVKAYGPMSESFGLGYLERIDDPFYYALAALETKDGKTYRPAAILSQSTIRSAKRITNPSIRDAFVLARNGNVNPSLEDIAEIAKQPADKVRAELVESGAVFETPGGDIVPSDMYLSGNVREKLRQAKVALADGNDAMQRNVAALEKVQPADIPYFNIEVQMGATWVPTRAYEQFVAHMLNRSDTDGISANYTMGRWKVTVDSSLQRSTEAQTGFGTRYYRFGKLVNAAISNQTVVIKERDRDGREFVDQAATDETNAKIADMREKFGDWLWSDAERRIEIEREYNEVRNAYASPSFDGSFLNFDGMALSVGRGPFDLRQHQVNAIWRALVMRRSLNAHEVGTGKTFTMGGIAVESRRYGIAKKPVLLAHNANSKSVASEIQMMYPAAKVLYIDNLSPKAIDVRLRQIANDDWDLIVLPHSLIERLSFREETLMAMAREEIEALEAEARLAASDDGQNFTDAMLSDPDELKKLRSPTAKELVKARARIIETIKKQAQQSSREGAVPFEDLGIDMVLVDEAHEFKKPPIATRMKMKGLQTQSSLGSIQLSFLTRYVREQNNGGNIHLFTGTPITNTLTEIFHQMRYIMADEMAAVGVDQWDGWFGSFAKEVQDVELTAAGDYEAVNRLRGFINVPELRKMVGQYMDVVFSDDMPEMQPRRTASGKLLADQSLTEQERAELLNGRTEGAKDRPYKKVVNETADPTPDQMRIFEEVQSLANEWRNMGGKARRDAMSAGLPVVPIVYEQLAARASFDARMENDEALAGKEGNVPDHPDSKVSRAIRNLLEIYRSDTRATQVVFTNTGLGTTANRALRDGAGGTIKDADGVTLRRQVKVFSPIKDMVERLVQQGIPRSEIEIVDGSTSKDRRKEIADAMNAGTVRIVIGSTQSLGVGVNMQRNLRAMHHLDAPWMPGDLEQRNGRGHRQGNQWNTVMEYRYITDRIDGRRWQVLAIKQKFITDFLKADGDTRVIEGDAASDEESDIISTFAEAAGDPRVLIRQKLVAQVEQLQKRDRLHTEGVADAKRTARNAREDLVRRRAEIERIEQSGAEERAAKAVADHAGDKFRITVDGVEFSERKAANEAIGKFIGANMRTGADPMRIGSYGGLPLHVAWPRFYEAPVFVAVVAGEEVATGAASVASLESSLRAYTATVDKLRARIQPALETIQRLDEVSGQTFQRADQLKRAEQQLRNLEKDIQLNPVPPPAWLRNGAAIDTEVRWNGAAFVVTGHRWNGAGWFVIAQDAKGGEVVIPYLDAKDAQGMPLYEAREFKAPIVHAKKDEAPKDGTGPTPETVVQTNIAKTAEPRSKDVVDEEARWESEGGRVRASFAKSGKPSADVYARGADGARGMPADKLTRLLATAKQAMALLGVNIEVVANGSDLPAEITAQDDYDDTVQAAITGDRKTVYFVASRIASPRAAMKLVAHELVGHMSMEQLLGKRWPELRDAILRLRDNGKWPEVFAEVSRRYERNADGTFRALDDATFAAEAIAVFAERNIQTSILQRAVNAVRAWLRRLGFAMDMSQGELRQMLWEAGQKLEGRAYRAAVVDDVLGAKPEPKQMSMREAVERYSFGKAGTIVDRLQEAINPKDTTLLQRLKDKLSDWRPAALGALQLRHLGELAERILPPVAMYSGVVQRMATMRNELQELGHKVVEAGMKYQGKNPEESKRLFKLLHDATLAGVDPANAHQPLRMMAADYRTNVDVTDESVRAFVKLMNEQAKLNPGSAVSYVNRAKEARKLLSQERKRRVSYKELAPAFAKLSADGKALWVQMRDAYAAQSDEYQAALISRIESLSFDKAKKAGQIARMRLQFESARVPFYVPLARWGEYWVSGTNSEGQREFFMQESQGDQKRVIKELEKSGYLDIGHGVKLDTVKAQDGASASFMADMDEMLTESGAPEKIRDEAFQLYLRSLPDLSMRKNFIHRQGTPGYSQDALRALAGHIFHGSFQIARLRYAHELEGLRTEAEDMAKDMGKAGDPDANAAGNIVNELKKRHEWVMNPQDNAIINKISSIGFVYYLGLTPAAALVNLLQTPMVALPILAGKHKLGAATRELMRAMKESMSTYGHMQTKLEGDELEAHKEFARRGVFDKTQAHNMAGISESDTHAYSPTWHKMMTVISHVFHKAEVVNRESTAMAAYRLERAAGAGHIEAVEAADRAVHESQFDYSNANRARFMQSGTAKVLLMFRQYSLAVTWLLGRNMYQAFKGEDAATKREAKRKLAGILGMTAIFSGTLGLPIIGTVGAVLNAVAAAVGDDDEPWDWETEFRAFLREMLGETGAEAVLRGPVQAATGVGIANRVSMGDLWFREPDRELEGRAWSNYLFEQAAGPMGGLITNFFRGQQLMGEGQVWRGVETMMPKAIKDAMKSLRYLDEGVNNLRGDAIVEDLNVFESLAQIAGFAPASVANVYDMQRDLKGYEDFIERRRSRLMDAYALAWRLGDKEAQTAVIEKMQAFSRTYPQWPITADSIRTSLQSRARGSAQAELGIIVNPKLRGMLEQRLALGTP